MKPSSVLGESFFKHLADSTPGLVAVYNIRTGKYIYVNSGLKKILGFPPEKLLQGGLSFISPLVHPDDMERIMKQNAIALNIANRKTNLKTDDPIVSFEYRLKDSKGRWHWLQTDGTVFSRNDKGKVEYVLNISIDITTRKETEEKLRILKANLQSKIDLELRQSQERLDLAQKAGKLGAFEWFVKEDKVYWTPELEMLYGLPIGSFKGNFQDWIKRVHPGDVSRVKENIKEALSGVSLYSSEFRIISQDGSIHWILGRGEVYFDRSEKPIRMLGINMDITEKKMLERQKDDFIGIASHELKTPVTSIKGYTQILQQFFSEDKRASEYLSRMNNQVTRLTILINDLLDVSKLQSGKLELNLEEFILDDLIKETVEEIQLTTSRYELIFKSDFKGKVVADKYRINQVLVNLISNAIKYSPKANKVVIKTRKIEKDILVEVKDYGIGIAPKDKEKIFERFYQATNKIRPSFSGLGLGLYISSEIIKRHNGRIWIESRKGQGSSFFFLIPRVFNNKGR